jgi:chromosome segregation and condensation protein ScpB
MYIIPNDYAPLPTGDALREYWLPRLTEGERKILEVAITAYRDPVDREALRASTGYKSTSIYEYTRKLLARKLLVSSGPGKVRASEELFS